MENRGSLYMHEYGVKPNIYLWALNLYLHKHCCFMCFRNVWLALHGVIFVENIFFNHNFLSNPWTGYVTEISVRKLATNYFNWFQLFYSKATHNVNSEPDTQFICKLLAVYDTQSQEKSIPLKQRHSLMGWHELVGNGTWWLWNWCTQKWICPNLT